VNELTRGRLAIKYIVFELLPVFVIGLTVFVFVLIMFQSFKLSEYVIVHGAQIDMVLKLVFYTMLGALPILFPIALLFAVLMVYGRLSGDSEIVALKALGLAPLHITTPVLIVGATVALISIQTTFRLAPWGQRNLDTLVSVLAQTKPSAALREGVFSEGFFDLVVYANRVHPDTGKLQKIFIFDERDPKSPVTVIASQGEIVNSNSLTGQEAYLRLFSGSLHKSTPESYTKINYQSYDINLFDPHEIKEEKASTDAMTYQEIRTELDKPKGLLKPYKRRALVMELNRRWSLSAACLVFGFLGVSLSAVTNRRTARSGSLVICISAIVVYWSLMVAVDAMARTERLPAELAAWIPNVIFLGFAIFQFRKVMKT
jgi:lipopolysaccharide export system permease protein